MSANPGDTHLLCFHRILRSCRVDEAVTIKCQMITMSEMPRDIGAIYTDQFDIGGIAWWPMTDRCCALRRGGRCEHQQKESEHDRLFHGEAPVASFTREAVGREVSAVTSQPFVNPWRSDRHR